MFNINALHSNNNKDPSCGRLPLAPFLRFVSNSKIHRQDAPAGFALFFCMQVGVWGTLMTRSKYPSSSSEEVGV